MGRSLPNSQDEHDNESGCYTEEAKKFDGRFVCARVCPAGGDAPRLEAREWKLEQVGFSAILPT